MRIKAICCEVFRREMYYAAARSKNAVDLEFYTQGLHDIGSIPMRERLQDAINGVESRFDAIALGYGLCNNGLAGIRATRIPLVMPRAHDCITLFLGSKERYTREFEEHPGTYFKTSGWIERNDKPEELTQISIQRRTGMDSTFEDLVAKYGEDNARFLYETLVQNTHFYSRLAYIEMGIEPDDRWEREVREDAAQRKWDFEKIAGNLSLIQRLLDGDWDDEDFLVVRPGESITMANDEQVVRLEDFGVRPRALAGEKP